MVYRMLRDLSKRGIPLQDMHCHLDFASNARELACQACQHKLCVVSTTVSPADYDKACADLLSADAVSADVTSALRVGLGFHPWWVSEDPAQNNELLELFLAKLPQTTTIGEIGLDAAARHRATFDQQRVVFSSIITALRNHEPSTLSLHGIRAYDVMFELLDAAQIWDKHAVILHWFSGSSDDLVRARSHGAFFSVNAHMLVTKRGRAYAQAIPLQALLVETDWPPEKYGAASFDEWHQLLANTYATLADIRKLSVSELEQQLVANAQRALR